LRYFNETLKEIDEYFDQAEKIVRRSQILDPSKAAMHSILQNVSEPSDIADKRNEFNQLLKKYGIQCEDYSFDLSSGNGLYCLDYEVFTKDKDPLIADKIYSDLTLLNWIYIKREKRTIESFANIRAVLLTGNYHVMQLAMDEKLRQPKELALAATLDFLTTRFWFSLCRGLSKDCNLMSASVLTKARLALASLNCESINKAYQAVEKEMSEGKYDKEQMKSRIASLHRRFRLPENVDDLTDKNNLAFFTDCRSDVLLAEEAAKEAAHNQEIIDLKLNLEAKDKTIKQQSNNILLVLKDRLREINEKEQQEYEDNCKKYIASHKDWVDKQMRTCWVKNLLIDMCYLILLAVLVIVPFIHGFPKQYFWAGALILILSSIIEKVVNWVESKTSINICKSLSFCLCKSKRDKKRIKLDNEYYNKYPKPNLIQTSLEELKTQYDKKY
jgi:hypothetical protein